MARHSALAVANEILSLREVSYAPSQMQLQKLVFNAHGWNLAVNGEPLIEEHAQAWDNGPVFRSIWNHIRDFGHNGPKLLLKNPLTNAPYKEMFSSKELDVIRRTWNKYNSFSGLELSRMAHEQGSPWSKAYFNRGRNAALSDKETKEYYTKLALAGRV